MTLFVAAPAVAQQVPGPIPADVVSVYDGDSLTVQALVWPGHTVTTAVRLAGVDAPEIKGRCEEEKAAALAARDHLRSLVQDGRVFLWNVQVEKYGRALAAVSLNDGRDVAAEMLAGGFGRPYGGEKRAGWCSKIE
mgnify:FL=1